MMSQHREQAASTEHSLAVIQIVRGTGSGRMYKIVERATIGRGDGAEIHLDDPSVSRSHAVIRLDPTGLWEIVDLDSSNGSYLNGSRIRQAELHDGDTIRLGNELELIFSFADPERDQLLQRQRLETLGRLGTGIAHDFNNMQGVILSTLEYLRRLSAKRSLGSADVIECLADIEAAASRASQLASHLLDFARTGQQEHTEVSVTEICTEAVQMLRRMFGRSITITTAIEPEVFTTGCAGELHQILMNLALNANDAMPEGGELRIRTALIQPTQLPKQIARSTRPHVLISVQDTGHGMTEEVKSQIFESFFTTKREGAGFGLGLATVKDIVRRHAGIIQVESELDSGTKIQIFLPALVGRTVRIVETTPPPATEQGTVIMIIDDDKMVRKSVSRILHQAGHQVIEASSGQDGIARYAARHTRPDLVLLDVDMPAMNGPETIGVLRELDPSVKVAFVSGMYEGDLTALAHRSGAVGTIKKPCSTQQLLDHVATFVSSDSEDDEPPITSRQTYTG